MQTSEGGRGHGLLVTFSFGFWVNLLWFVGVIRFFNSCVKSVVVLLTVFASNFLKGFNRIDHFETNFS